MFTLRTADDDALKLNDGNVVPAIVIDREESCDEVSSASICEHYQKPRVKKRHLTAFALFVFLGQTLISVSLKRYGWIERDFNEIVSEMVVPRLQEQLEQGLAWSQFNESLYWLRRNQSMTMGYTTQERARPGYQLAEKGAKSKYPVVMIPGFVTSGLEVWRGKECAKNSFRQRMWGGVGSVQNWLMERHCVMEHLALDPRTGKDPDDIRIRAAQGFEAADYFMGNYWVWGKILENLADIGYDGSTMSMESYDWRLSFPMLEERDGFLTKLKYKIEAFHKSTGKKVVLTSHSLGGILVHYFFAWVTAPEKDGGGGGGKDWVDEHIHAYVNIAGAHLGVPKAASALLSGEMSDTIFMGAVGSLVEQFIGRKLRRDLFATWGSLWSMLPKGGDALWGIGADIKTNNPEDANDKQAGGSQANRDSILEPMLVLRQDSTKAVTNTSGIACLREQLLDEEYGLEVNEAINEFASRGGHPVSHVVDFLLKYGGGFGPKLSATLHHSFDKKARASPATWHDVSRTPLPHAPNLKVYCLYGVGLPTERAYYYKRNEGETLGGTDCNGTFSSNSVRVDPPFILDTSVEDPENDVIHGVKYVDGDASVPLLSLGYMCADAWRRKNSGLNPGGTKITTREYKHKQEFSVEDPMRAGPYSTDHVDILGNINMMEDLLKIVSDKEVETLKDRFISDIEVIAKRINDHPKGGIKKRRTWPFQNCPSKL